MKTIESRSRNPYPDDSPEHHLWETAVAADLSALAHEKEKERHAEWARNARIKAEQYRAALETLIAAKRSSQ